MGVLFMDKLGIKIIFIINAKVFDFITFVKDTPLWGKKVSKV